MTAVVAITGRTRASRLFFAAIANALNSLGNAVAVFALSVAATNATSFGLIATSLASMMFAFGVNRAIVGETLTLQAHVRLVPVRFLAASSMVAITLAGLACGVLLLSSGTRPLALLSGGAVFCFLVNDALRYWAFRADQARLVAITDAIWLAFSTCAYLLAAVGWLGPRAVYALWAVSGLLLALPLIRVRHLDERGATQSARQWLASSRSVSVRLAAEAAAVTAAVTVPLAAAPLLGLSGETSGAVRLLQVFFGFQQIAFFSALVSLGRLPEHDRHQRIRAGSTLALGGAAMSIAVGLCVWLLPPSLLISTFGDATAIAQTSVWSFVMLQILVSAANGTLLGLRLSGRAARATVPRVVGALCSTVLATALMHRGVVGYAVGSATGTLLFMLMLVPELRRAVIYRNRSRTA